MVTPDRNELGDMPNLGMDRGQSVAEMKYLENNMGGKLVDNYVIGQYAASSIFYEVRKCFN